MERELSEKQLAVLRDHQFAAGTSGNPGGRPKTKKLLHEVERLLDEPCTLEDGSGKTWREQLALKILEQVTRGRSLPELWNRLEGKISDELVIASAPAQQMYETYQRERARIAKLTPAELVGEIHEELYERRRELQMWLEEAGQEQSLAVTPKKAVASIDVVVAELIRLAECHSEIRPAVVGALNEAVGQLRTFLRKVGSGRGVASWVFE